MGIRVIHYHPIILWWWWMALILIPTLVISTHADPDLASKTKKNLHSPTGERKVSHSGGGGHIPHGIFTLLPFGANPFSALYRAQNQRALSNASIVGSGKEAKANALSRSGGHVLSTASVIGKGGHAFAKAFSVGGRDRGENSAVSIASGKQVMSSAGSDGVGWEEAGAVMEESSGGGTKLREEVDKYFTQEEGHGSKKKDDLPPPPLSKVELKNLKSKTKQGHE